MRIVLWLLCCLALPISPAEARAFFTAEEFAGRRERLLRQIPDGVAILLGGETPEAYLRFRQSNAFYYFTGVEAPDCVAVLNGVTRRTTLFVPERSSDEIPAEARVTPGRDGQARTGIENVVARARLSDSLAFALSRPEVKTVYLVLAPEEGPVTSRDQASDVERSRVADPWDGRVSRIRNFARLVRDRYPHLAIKDLTTMVDEMRWVKSPAEIAVLRECGRIGAAGVREAIAATRPGLFEYFLDGVATGAFIREGANGIAFQAIVASGENTVTLHYLANNAKMKAGDVVLMDYAPELNHYVTDITRSWPVSGQFTVEQLKVYNCLLDAHKQTIAAVRPGVRVSDLNRICRGVFERHGYGRNLLGGIGHFVGMTVHDPGFYDRPFVAGVVFNVEPLFMDREKKLHMRLEDTIVVTANGHENVTAGVTMEVPELYRLMRLSDQRRPTNDERPATTAQPGSRER